MPELKIYKTPDGQYTLSGNCTYCNIPQVVTVTAQAYYNWDHGMFVQNAFPNLSKDEREFLVSGICGKCFDKMFAEPEE